VLLSFKILLISLSKNIESKSKKGGTWTSGKVKDSRRSLIMILGDGSLSKSSFNNIYLLLYVYGSSNKPKKGIYSENIYIKLYRNIYIL
jgi:hypothetical protein